MMIIATIVAPTILITFFIYLILAGAKITEIYHTILRLMQRNFVTLLKINKKQMENIYIITAILIFSSIALAIIIRKKTSTIKEKEEIIEHLKQELNAANIKYIQAEERRLSQKNILEQERKNNILMIEEIKSQNNLALENIKNQLAQITEKNLKERSEELKSTNIEQISHILNPMQEQMKRMEESVRNVSSSSAEHKASIEKTIEGLAQQTIKVGEQADELAKALKNNSKVQGDWGEQLLETILDNSGLRKGYEYTTQENFKDGKKDLRPDVIIHCPGNRNIIIDSKVSLTAYVDYLASETKEEAERLSKANKDSVKKHIDELSAKNYTKLVENTISHVLMFIPNEGSYILALRNDPQLGQYAYKKGILLINPTNLMIALQLIYNIWQSEKQAKNVEKVIKESELLYEKFVNFSENWGKIKENLEDTLTLYDKADKQLYEGNGNIVRRLEKLKELGIIPKKNIPETMLTKAKE
ncbi:MAG: DNA recombination protein RmuC [Bacteroidales bacterium]|nr:DNA recombination protein RmuC [Bacteroidales bacterium]